LYANQAATAVDNLRLYADLEASYYDTLLAFVAAMEAKDPYTKGHSENVQRYAVALARHLGLPDDRVKLVDDSALLHDIGKLGVKESILTKPASLSEAEFEEVKQHPLTGGQMVSRIENLATSTPARCGAARSRWRRGSSRWPTPTRP
ncbi:MAG: HD domain-containing protein, partial [Candidatus Edwardsbacteria bacterium]|nr:HD domain-containing protein [Candidatus Edwardsbacteria bacterium]